MRKGVFTILFLSVFICCKSQNTLMPDSASDEGEFTKNSNGLIYSDQDIIALRFIVDSLNLKFKTCELNKKYLSYPQARLYKLRFSSKTNPLSEIKNELEKNAPLQMLRAGYAEYLVSADTASIIVKTPYIEDGRHTYLTGNAFEGFGKNYFLSGLKNVEPGKWLYQYDKKGEYSDSYSLTCWFIVNSLTLNTIPSQYARLIQYVDCMIDTSAKIFLTEDFPDEHSLFSDHNSFYREVNSYLNKKMGLKRKDSEYDYDYLNNSKKEFAIKNLSKDTVFIKKISGLADYYIKNGSGNDFAEDLIASLLSREKALRIKRGRRVMGQCSMDNSPREHAKNIASLAAETHSWDIFLRSHLDIMNDRFDRMSDGSYAWGQRKTYIKELEVLDINVIDLMLGLSLRAYNNSENHYNGTVWRIGRALAESKNRLLFEESALNSIKDNSLDEFNRSLLFLLYQTYINYLSDSDERKSKVERLKKELNDFPPFIQESINKMKTTLPD